MKDNDRSLNKEERLWFSRLRRLIKSMPDTIEISICSGGEIELHEKGSVREHVDEYGDIDNVPHIVTVSSDFIPRSETS